MIYGPTPIRMATSADLYDWKPGGTLFAQTSGARDPSVLFHDGRYIVFYVTGNAVLARTSADLRKWSADAAEVFRMRRGGDPESPSVVERDGQFYLFWCQHRSRNSGQVARENRFTIDLRQNVGARAFSCQVLSSVPWIQHGKASLLRRGWL